jgi:hypothetical protein
LKTRHLEKSGVFILLKACPTGFLNGNHKHELPVVAMFVNGSGRNEHSL